MGISGRPGYHRATVVGGGVIGISWTALFLAHGLEVTVCDPLPNVAERVRAGLREIAPTLAQLGLSVGELTDGTDALGFDPDAASAVAGADVVQENGPERSEVKQRLWSVIEAGAPANALLASSSSGIPASVMSQAMRQPGRLVIGHPFNPPHLVPLVEVVPSPGTDPEVVDAAVAFYRAMGKQPQVLSREIPGFVANRLQAALFREAVYLVAQGVVTEQELDAVVTSSIGDALGGGRSVSDLPSGGWTWRPGRLPRTPGSGLGGPVGDPGPCAPGCRHDQAPHDPGRALRRNRGGAGSPSRSGADPPDASLR
jgi:ketoreductase RED1